MLFNSYIFILLFPIFVIVFFILPNKYSLKNIWLVICSYYFYCYYDYRYAFIIFGITLISYIFGLINAKQKNGISHKKVIFIAILLLILAIFFAFKYLNFTVDVIHKIYNLLFGNMYQRNFNIILPIGISFYTLQAISYVVDVYKGKMQPETSILKYTLYISFFPQLVAGPIERASSFIPQIDVSKKFDYTRFKSGFLQMTYGFFQKLVVADRAAILVNMVYGNIASYSGASIILATFVFGIQIYCDFAGYSNIAIGAARILGFELTKNFDMPYLSCSISEFWKRWHITFSSWLRDYVYIPLGGNKCSTIRRNVNLFLTFLVSGIWHGANFTYAIWGAVNGVLIIVDKGVSKFVKKVPKVIKIAITYILINFTWLFFRANSLEDVFVAIKNIFASFKISNLGFAEILEGGFESIELVAFGIATSIMIFIEAVSKKIDIFKWIFNRNIVIRWTIYYVAIFAIIIFGVYGLDSSETTFIYAQF